LFNYCSICDQQTAWTTSPGPFLLPVEQIAWYRTCAEQSRMGKNSWAILLGSASLLFRQLENTQANRPMPIENISIQCQRIISSFLTTRGSPLARSMNSWVVSTTPTTSFPQDKPMKARSWSYPSRIGSRTRNLGSTSPRWRRQTPFDLRPSC